MKFIKEYWHFLVIGILLLIILIGSCFVGRGDSNSKQKEKEYKQILDSLRKEYIIGIKEAEEKIDTVYITIESAEKEKIISDKLHKDVKDIINETKRKTKAIDDFSRDAVLLYFHESVIRYREDSL